MQQNIEKSLRLMEAGSYQTLDRRSRRGKYKESPLKITKLSLLSFIISQVLIDKRDRLLSFIFDYQ